MKSSVHGRVYIKHNALECNPAALTAVLSVVLGRDSD